ncbi:ABC-F family ATP-binding cassette domain-containing protein [Polluticaenibacter yanchengensis]|uniref:ABC-F family ATP-binding cassette domain-containing protein n=1 Tax=Polluticaenibacter yanchengensis TaxID=3014562 RepID=A0ABT4ULF0_9BACT|nr:ABC-F family ATP-binding cassette domain-containing protein [Chitinophagaceae bacterium LY-5]
MLAGFTNVTFEFGARAIIRNATWHIQPGERIGLVGYNGTGKSTILKLLVGEYTATGGVVERGKSVSIGYLHQDLLSAEIEKSILEVAMDAFQKARDIQAELHELEKQLETKGDDADLLDRYSHLLHDFEVAGGYEMEHKAEEILHGLGFDTEVFNKPYQQFSGGWRMRVLLAKMILQAPDILLLDEPTNHLDLPSIEWLEKYLIHYEGSVVIVSHDQYFLNRMVTKIVDVYQQELHQYTGNYEYFVNEKALRIELQQKAYENQQDFIRQQERVVERFKAKASKAAMAQSIIKKLDKLDRIENVELERPNIRMNFAVDKQPGKVICTLKNVSKSYGDLSLLKNASAEISRGDKIALIGANGKGKSTLLRIIAGTEGHEGSREWGHNVVESFYAQHQLESLGLDNNLIEEMQTSRAGKTDLEYRTLLGCFLFGGDDVDKRIKVLSGGEKARVALAKTIVSKANFLMLDEPTNHLDMHSVDLLIESLNKYEGSLIIVSHDRHFLSRTANIYWEIVNGEIREFKGTYEEYVRWKEKLNIEEAARLAKEKEEAGKKQKKEETKAAVQAPQPDKPYVNLNMVKTEYQKQQKQFDKIEAEQAKLKADNDSILADLANPAIYSDQAKLKSLEAELKKVQDALDKVNEQYETAFTKLMELEEQLQNA